MIEDFDILRAEGPGLDVPARGGAPELPAGALRSLNRHLAVAATQLARAEGLPPGEAARYAAAGARFRALVEVDGDLRNRPPLEPPVVDTEAGTVPLASLLLGALDRLFFRFPPRSIDPGLVREAKELLCTQPWRLPDPGTNPATRSDGAAPGPH